MDIERLSQIGSTLDTRLRKKRDDEKERASRAGKTSFDAKLGEASEQNPAAELTSAIGELPRLDGSETIEGLLDDVHEAGEALKKDPVFGPLNGYKKAVRRFLKYIIDNSIVAEEQLGIRNPRTMQQKKYLMIRVVDEKLESLAAHVLKGQAEQLDVLRRIEEINGLLVDLSG